MEALLAHKARVDTADDAGWSPVLSAASAGNLELLRLLWPLAPAPTAISRSGGTALIHAASKGHAAVVAFLLEQGAVVDARDKQNNTALLRGARYTPVVQLLLARGASAVRANTSGDTALHLAAEEGNEEACALLLAAGADPNVRNGEGRSAKDVGGKAMMHVWGGK